LSASGRATNAKIEGMSSKRSEGGLVYSTDHGRMCPTCRQAQESCICKAALVPKGDGNVKVSRETKGRGGKAVTVVKGLPLDAESLAALGKRLRTACGSGGTAKDGVLEVQGDHAERVVAWLVAEGFKAKRSGG
jgi:translation initiation factor 1